MAEPFVFKRILRSPVSVYSTHTDLSDLLEEFTAIQSTKMSKVMQVLTILSTVFLPATLVASIYGMNFKIPEYHWKYGYPYVLGLMVVIALGFIVYMKKRGWF